MSLLYTPVCEAGITADGFKYDIDNFMRSTDYLVMYLRCTSANWYLVNNKTPKSSPTSNRNIVFLACLF